MAAQACYVNPDEWELITDDGYVYKRRKRPRLDSGGATTTTSSSSAHPPPDPAAEKKHRRERKKKALLMLRDQYLQEISRWELLSNTLRQMEQKAQTPSLEQNQELDPWTTSFSGASVSENAGAGSDSTRRRLVDDLLTQAEAQEIIIKDVSKLCDIAEALCSAEEERLKQQLTDLPIWDPSPQDLMAALGKQ
ncbi:hypothetical protein STAS_18013 [Striga asiatica]|uniref:Uncharacterized protein n=1 Tax=Striga asiatica TaxID=4170 RepID=A0A5A7QA52_STRAF|nr:hypothetical protein STAS_18013 [Striga asiatica]